MSDYTYAAVVTRVVDGDTIDCSVDLGFNMMASLRFRLHAYDAPEVTGVERVHGGIARDYLSGFLRGENVTLTTHKGDSFGRWLASVELADGRDLVLHLLGAGYGVAWDGRGLRPSFDPTSTYPLEPR